MDLEHTFEIPATVEATWDLLNDVPRVIPCFPGAELTEIVDADTFKVTTHVKLGAIALRFGTDVYRQQADAEARRAVLTAKARELKGRGGASATITSVLRATESGTSVTIGTDIQMQGTIASTGRGIVADVASNLVDRFAACLQAQLRAADGARQAGDEQRALAAAPGGRPETPKSEVKAVGVIGLLVRALLRRLRRNVGRPH